MPYNFPAPGTSTIDPPNRLRKEGDYVIEFIKLVAYNGAEYDVTQIQFITNIYEDLFHNVVTGDISFQDANDLAQLMPLIGQERIKIRFTRPQPTDDPFDDELLPPIDVDFRIYNIAERQLEKDKFQVYTLYFISEEFITNLKTKFVTGFKGLPYSDMAKVAFETLGSKKPFIIEPTIFDQDWISPNIPPIEFINTIAARSVSAEGNGASYVFFADRDSFHFVSFGKLIEQPASEVYTYQWSNILENGNSNSGYRPRTAEQDLRAMERYGFSGSFNILSNLACGMYASRLLTYDIVRQVFDVKDYDYLKDFNTFKHTDKNKPLTETLDALGSPTAVTKFLSTNKDHDILPWIAAKEPGIKPYQLEEYTLYRYAQIQQIIGNNKLRVSVSGDPRRKVGQTIDFKLPQALSNITKETPEELDKYMQGKYLITSLVHRLSKGSYYMEAEIVKDTFFTGIEHVDPNDVYKDIW